MKVSVHLEEWQFITPFRIAGVTWHTSRSIVVQISDQGFLGRGEAQGVYYLADSLLAEVNAISGRIKEGISREQLLQLMPAGGARNAIDCALWDLECKISGQSIWQLTGITQKPQTTVFTIGLEKTPEAMAEKALAANSPALKIKLDQHQPYERLAAIRAACPDADLVVDANQSWSFEQLKQLLPKCIDLNLSMIEQPLARGSDEVLEGFNSPIVLAGDESCLHTAELEQAAKRYTMINIKLDKTGGLTEALILAKAAREKGCQLMVGNMCGTSLSMAPSFVLAQLCDFVDLDGPLLLKYDHPSGLKYSNGMVSDLQQRFWG